MSSSRPLTGLRHPRHPAPLMIRQGSLTLVQFQAMASDCEILFDLPPAQTAQAAELARIAVQEVWRIEEKFSRYLPDNDFARLHQQRGHWQVVDEETARLLEFAGQAWALSDGLFDLTSGLLRQVWKFDGSDRLPSAEAVAALLPRIGWQRLSIRQQQGQTELLLPEGMELDFGGIGKEYAVDRALGLLMLAAGKEAALLVNLGGDMACSGPRRNGDSWKVGIERPGAEQQAVASLSLAGGALATSGDSKRFLLKDGVRYSHILNPLSGWPVTQAFPSVTVAGPTCVQCGLIATLALLQGAQAEAFLQKTGLRYWLVRP